MHFAMLQVCRSAVSHSLRQLPHPGTNRGQLSRQQSASNISVGLSSDTSLASTPAAPAPPAVPAASAAKHVPCFAGISIAIRSYIAKQPIAPRRFTGGDCSAIGSSFAISSSSAYDD